MRTYDVIVIGTGGVGSAAMYHLARRGAHVLGLDQFPPAHALGSSHGATRIIRKAYYEHPDYVPLLHCAYDLWAELADEAGEELYRRTGLMQAGPADGEVLPGILQSCAEHGLAIEELTGDEVSRRWPGLRVPENLSVVYEHEAGFLRVERCVHAHLRGAVAAGATLRVGERVPNWECRGGGVIVHTESKTFEAGRLVIAAGAWSSKVLADLGIELEVRRKAQFWFDVDDDTYDLESGCPAFLFEMPTGIYYGFPRIDLAGVKLAEHVAPGEAWGQTEIDADRLYRNLDPDDEARVASFTAACLPQLSPRLLAHSVCMYTMTRDGHFIVDQHPEHPQVAIAAGLSGHGFKFTGVLGQALSDLVINGRIHLPLGFLGISRDDLKC